MKKVFNFTPELCYVNQLTGFYMRETYSWHLITSGLIFQLFHHLHQFPYCWLPCYLFLDNTVFMKNSQFFEFFQMVRSFFIEKKIFLAMVSQGLSKDIRQFSKMNHGKNESSRSQLFFLKKQNRDRTIIYNVC